VATGGVLSGATITVNETITSIVYVFILWVAIAGASHMISTALRGGGEFHPQMTTLIGFSTIPICIGYAIYMMAPYGVIIPIAVIWSVIISFFGVKESRNLTSTKSVISAGASLLWLLLLL
ncbi:MAG: YIP1 family protein, partial [Halobacteriota archaeon]|nr:YIP1 family protein [Halobacteriota archaeon]